MKVWEVKLIVDAIVDGPLNDFILFLIPVSMSIPCIKQKNQFTVFKYPDDILNILLTLKLIVINILTPTVSRKLNREIIFFFIEINQFLIHFWWSKHWPTSILNHPDYAFLTILSYMKKRDSPPEHTEESSVTCLFTRLWCNDCLVPSPLWFSSNTNYSVSSLETLAWVVLLIHTELGRTKQSIIRKRLYPVC